MVSTVLSSSQMVIRLWRQLLAMLVNRCPGARGGEGPEFSHYVTPDV